jgi:ribonuclease I
MQCAGRPYAFVVHGLWPQYEKGFPSYCQVPAPKLDRGIVTGALTLMPSPALMMHEWERHGTCSGLSSATFFETVRKARAVVKIPEAYLDCLRQDAVDRSAVVPQQGFFLPRLPGDCTPDLHARQTRYAGNPQDARCIDALTLLSY